LKWWDATYILANRVVVVVVVVAACSCHFGTLKGHKHFGGINYYLTLV
jgi:hypothetical protein